MNDAAFTSTIQETVAAYPPMQACADIAIALIKKSGLALTADKAKEIARFVHEMDEELFRLWEESHDG